MPRSHAVTIQGANQDLIAKGAVDAIARYFTPDYVAHLTDRDLPGGHAGIRRFLDMLRSSFPDLSVEVEILVEAKDRVAWQRTLRGKHTGEFMGFPATGRRVVWRDMITSRFRDGLIAEEWAVSDLAERLLLARKP